MSKNKYTFWQQHQKTWTEEKEIIANSLEEAENILHGGQDKSTILYVEHQIINNGVDTVEGING